MKAASAVHFTADDWARVTTAWTRWWAGDLERPIVAASVPHAGQDVPRRHHFTGHYPRETAPATIIADEHAHLCSRRWIGDGFPHFWPNFGPGIAAGFLGAQVHGTPDSNTIWFEPPEPRIELAELQLHVDPQNHWWQRVCAITAAAIDFWRGDVLVGHSDLGGNLDVLASFLTTEELLMALYDAPEHVTRVVRQITEAWLWYYDQLAALIEPAGRGTSSWAALCAPGRGYMLQCDFSYMISPRMFEQFVAPDLAACCARLDQAFYHLDGKGELPHLDVLLGMERLRGIQWVPGAGQPPPEQWPDVLARIKKAGKLCQLYVSPEGALDIVRTHGGKGFALFVGELTSVEEGEAFLRTLAREDCGA